MLMRDTYTQMRLHTKPAAWMKNFRSCGTEIFGWMVHNGLD